MTIEKMLVISTAHVTPEIGGQLDYKTGQGGRYDPTFTISTWIDGLIIYPHGEYGWLINVRDSDDALPEPLAEALEQARCEGCDWLLLDRDGPEHNLLETFEWD